MSPASTTTERRTLTRRTYVNALPVNLGRLSDAAVDRLNGLRSGSYIGGRVTVVERDNGNGAPDVWIWFLNRTVQSRRENAALGCGSLDAMLSTVTAEAEARNAQ